MGAVVMVGAVVILGAVVMVMEDQAIVEEAGQEHIQGLTVVHRMDPISSLRTEDSVEVEISARIAMHLVIRILIV